MTRGQVIVVVVKDVEISMEQLALICRIQPYG